jgi:uncharacterized membrane protein
MNKNGVLRILMLILSLGGLAIMTYLLYSKIYSVESAFCELGEKFSCDTVNQSEYSKVFGIPVSAGGIVFFLVLLYGLTFKYSVDTVKKVLIASILFLIPSLYLTGVEHFVIHAYCVLCETSKVIVAFIILFATLDLGPKKPDKKFWLGTIALGVVLALGLMFVQFSGGPKDEYNEFAQCLTEKGYLEYGSATCASCAKQRAMFGEAYQFINEVECDPRNDHNQVDRCIAKGIKKTPTWFQEDAEQNTLYEFEPGIQSLEKLSEVSGCPLLAEAAEGETDASREGELIEEN